ncbi:hypothetical protein NKJ52_03375 [Mesorhizobium australicum]|uniref:hypothetical protein n=1 Tax=Mesorhizobium TaxID=68287 RepID=UPI003339BF96
MTTLAELLIEKSVRRALVVDDAYDPLPRAADLTLDANEWTNFFDDLQEPDVEIIRNLTPEYDALPTAELPSSDSFVASIWQNRDQIRPELVGPVFARYDADMATDLAYVNALVDELQTLGLAVETAGRNFEQQAADADLIVIDLFLGSVQDSDAIAESKTKLRRVVDLRRSEPPLVVLMSRSGRLEEKREEFRDSAGLLASAFRIVRKADLQRDGKLARILRRLAFHRTDSTRLAAFMDAWQQGVSSATMRAVGLMRTLDLPDYAQIQQLLLSEEGEPTGSYMVDIFDRILQYEIESEAAIIDAAITLNEITSAEYPPPYLVGSPDLQQLVYRSLFQNTERLRLAGPGGGVAFGDVLRPLPPPGEPPLPSPIADVGPNNVLAVLTPACDLQRGGAKRVLLLIGELRQLGARDWSYADDPVRTPVIELEDTRYWIKWDLKHVDTIGQDALAQARADGGGLALIGRLREAHALELQQKMLSAMGRVGLPAPMPATFPMQVRLVYPGADRTPVSLNIPALENDGVCFVGRPGLAKMRLVLSEDACEAISASIADLDPATVHPNAGDALRYLKDNPGELLDALANGVPLPAPDATTYKLIPSPSGALIGQNPRNIGLILRNGKENGPIDSGLIAKAGIVMQTTDIRREGGGSDAA